MPDAKTSFSKDIPRVLERDVKRARGVDGIIVFKISGKQGGIWTLNLRDEVGVEEGAAADPDCTIELSDSDWERITRHPGAAMQLFLEGKLRISGNAVVATRLQSVLG